ncbi:MAG: hypothetical protein HC936_11765 [Leptolyngbyaceae cyanobacterium SU_3_3]|nr:hypothetical protein [Leptolyngbyaceae cyanobacterium SU_3_3]
MEAKFDQEEALAIEVEEVRSHLSHSQAQLASEPDLQQQLAHLKGQLQALNDPRTQHRLLQQELKQQANLDVLQRQTQQALLDVQSTIADLDRQLATFTTLSDQIREQQSLREAHRAYYQQYLEHQQSANSLKGRQQQLQEAIAQLENLQQQTKKFAQKKHARRNLRSYKS